MKDKREEESEVDNHSSDSEWDSSDEQTEHEHGDSFDKLFDGQLCMIFLEMCVNKSNV